MVTILLSQYFILLYIIAINILYIECLLVLSFILLVLLEHKLYENLDYYNSNINYFAEIKVSKNVLIY